MDLWTEYEGRTIAGAYTLDKLLRSEGRNAFFSTTNGTGVPAVIRLTEAHYDQEETLKRWRQVAEVHQDNLIAIKRVGETTFDGVPLTYALLEPEDANLEDVLRERPLTTAETTQVAKSVLAALFALHDGGLVHEHIEPANVLAVGEVVKLRSDCVRECVADLEFNTAEGCAELRKRDVHDFGILLLRCLTLEKEWSPSVNVAEPFRQIIPRAIEGTWGLEQIGRVLDPAMFSPKPAAAASPAVASSPAVAPNPAIAPNSAPTNGSRPLVPESVLQPAAAEPPVPAQGTLPLQPAAALPATPESAPVFRPRNEMRATAVDEPEAPSRIIWIVCGAAALLFVWLLWHFLFARPSTPASSAAPAAAPVVTRSQAAAAPAPAAPVPAPQSERPAPVRAAAPVAVRGGWYVIAFTYNHEDQARTKASRLNGRHTGLHAEVFSPNGHAPYLVSLGGPMSRNEAEAVLRRARHAGMPRDTFIRNY